MLPMAEWLSAIRAWRRAGDEPAVVVTVESTRGSVPRAAGTKMLVTGEHVIGTIGGGHLEWTAIDAARARLASDRPATGHAQGAGACATSTTREAQRFVLGASLGQCCGGIVNLTFETIAPPLDDPAADAVERWFVESIASQSFHVVLFGAGHVGRAVAAVLGQVPCTLTWVDTREDAFPRETGANTRVVVTDAPEAEVDVAPPGASFLVMTHSHPLDETLSGRILARNDFAYFGLIGSMSKRRRFESRLVARGLDPSCFARMTCPIGVDGIHGKEPGVIAVAVVAQVLREHARHAASCSDTGAVPGAGATR